MASAQKAVLSTGVVLLSACRTGWIAGGMHSAQWALLDPTLELTSQWMLGVPPPSIHESSQPMLLAYDATRSTVVIAASNGPDGQSLLFFRVHESAVTAGGAVVKDVSRAKADRAILSLCTAPEAEGGLGVYCVGTHAVECLTLDRARLGPDDVPT
eukprot:CAMPEP_0115890234 /NCGR_PEP_ID=MMETSP0287-20121206/33244_1 /TAXON_ID=412157 /ORGANISM="Chrysochromulina rotalis, Strain UIO044" /LENGTH=155 /DNA_ID=CAMNT_0003346995 /DNA_START=1 /DNA_END=464 /DNA_ORIENTATION=-